jgi:hypothetical protein
MPTRDSSRVERRCARLDGNRPRTHPTHSGRKADDALDRIDPAHGLSGLDNEMLCDGLHQGAESISRWPFTAGKSRRRPVGPPVASNVGERTLATLTS